MLEINLTKIMDVALLGVRRAATFLALGVNAASNPDFKDYQLTSTSHIIFMPADLPDDAIQGYTERVNGFETPVERF